MGATHHRSDVEPAAKLWTRQTTRPIPLEARAVAATAQRRALDAALDRGPTPCQADPEAWFATTSAAVARASDKCLDCHAFLACAAYGDAMDSKRLYGVLGGRLRGRAALQITDDHEELA